MSMFVFSVLVFFFSFRRRHTICALVTGVSDVCSSDLVLIEEGASVWINVAMRAENYLIVVGAYTNIQDFAMLHVGGQTGTYVGAHCSVTHQDRKSTRLNSSH